MKKIDFGPRSAGDYVGLHVIPAHQQFLRISNLESAMAAAKALWETVGWLWLDRHPGVDRRKARADDVKAFDNDLFKRCPDLQLLRDLADAAKHGGELSSPNVTVTGLSGSGSPVAQPSRRPCSERMNRRQSARCGSNMRAGAGI